MSGVSKESGMHGSKKNGSRTIDPVPESKTYHGPKSQLPDVLTHPKFLEQAKELEITTSLSQMVYIVLEMGLFLAPWLLEDKLSRRAQQVLVWPMCSTCGTRLHSKVWESR